MENLSELGLDKQTYTERELVKNLELIGKLRVYNPDKKIIDDFTKNQLNFLANSMWFVNGFRTVLMAVITIT